MKERQPKNLSKLLNPTVLSGTLKSLNHMNKDQANFITDKLNEHLHSQIINTIGPVSPPMSRALQNLITKVNFQKVKEYDLLAVIKEKVLAEVKIGNNKKLINEAEEIERRLQNIPSPNIADLLQMDAPLRENPIFDSEIRKAKIIEYAKLIKLDEETTKKLADKNLLYFDDTDEAVLSDLVKEGIIKEDQKRSLILVSSLSKLTGDNLSFIKALMTQDLKSTANFVSWEKDDWQNLIKSESIPLPPNETIEIHAENIIFNIKRTYPSQFLVNRFIEKNESKRKINLLDSLNTLLENNNDRLIDRNVPASIDWRGIGTETRKKMQQDLEQLAIFANSYGRLELVSLINSKELDLAAKKQAINSRLQLVKKFFDNNPELDLRYANFFDTKDSNIDWENIQHTDRPMIRKQVMACQRILNIAKDPEDSITLLSKGYDSVMAISEKSESVFMQTSGLPAGKARLTYAKAQGYSEVMAHSYETIRDALRGQFKDIRMANLSTGKLANELQEIDGFAELFGLQNFCGCEECMSILSPAAYFVDLMRFIDSNVSQQVFAPPNDHHPLYLRERRKDLWELELTCENTHTLIPYLTIVNEVLEKYLKHVLSSQEDIYEMFSENSLITKVSFSLPFSLALEELRIYLNHFSTSLHEIYKTLRHTEQKVWRARIGLSEEEFAIIITQESPIENVKFRFGNPTSFTDFPLQGFIRFAEISREQLDNLLSIKFNPDLANIKIDRQEQDPSADELLQNFEEILNNLSDQRLDFIHRFIRLQKKTGWSISELDLVLTSLRDVTPPLISSDLDNAAVIIIAKLIDIQEKLKLKVEELCAFFRYLPVSETYPEPPADEEDRMLFERLFDLKKLFGVNPATGILNTSTSYHHYSLNQTNPDDKTIDPNTPLLLAGLSVSETELLLLFDLLKDEIPFDPNGDCILDRGSISLLYRHSKLAKTLKLSIEDFIIALRLNFTTPGNDVIIIRQPEDLSKFFKLIEFKEWIKTTPFNVSELYYILHGEESRAIKSNMTLENVANLVLEMQRSQDPPVEIKIDALKTRLMTLFNLTPNQLEDILNRWTGIDINDNTTAALIKTALNTTISEEGVPNNPSDLIPLIDLLKEIERTLLLFTNLKFKEETIHNITVKQQLLGIQNLKNLTLDDIVSLAAYRKHITLENDDEAESLLQSVLTSYLDNSNTFSPNDIDILSGLWKKDKSLIRSLVMSLDFPTIPIEAVEYLWKCLGISDKLGINGFSLLKLGRDNDYDDLLSSREIALGAFSSKYDDEKTRNEKLEPYRDRLNVIKRDILCKYIIASQADLKFKDFGDIYSYFLLDVEMGGCFRTSRIVCAISSLQLYVHRCLVNLEESDPKLAPIIEHVRVDPALIPAEEWEWRKNYRVWEANRKVFLYPENYLEPDLRDNKTPIFKELEDELLQKKITKDSVEAAYRKYLAQFADLSRLKIVGSYFLVEKAVGIYYFFARSQQDPPQYYYRKWIGMNLWTAWQKIDLPIDSDQVSAIIHLGKLYLFWISITTLTKTDTSDINHIKTKYTYTKYLMYSFLTEQEKWAPAQKLLLEGSSREIENELVPNKIVFPVKDNSIIVTGWNPELYGPYLLANKIDFFKNRAIAIIPYDRLRLIPINSTLLFLEKESSQPNNLRLRSLRNISIAWYEVFLEKALSDLSQWNIPEPGVVLPEIGAVLTNYFANNNFYPELHLVGYKPNDFIFKLGNQQYLIQRQYGIHIDPDIPAEPGPLPSPHPGPLPLPHFKTKIISSAMLPRFPWEPLSKRYMFRLSTSLADDLGEILFNEGLEEFLSILTQSKKEYPVGIDFVAPDELLGPYIADHVDFKGAYGTYYQELFFHIPFLIANHLNAGQKFRESKWWYERIFNPTAAESDNIPLSLPSDRAWQYINFRNVTIQKMKDILTDRAAIQMYEKDPFNPHAIARLRSNAYQKSIVMKYIDNLIDWGDYLFAQDTMESINEAIMLYVLASDILGKRPIEIGTCEVAMGIGREVEGEEVGEEEEIECSPPLTYEKMEACSVEMGTNFLIELENWQSANMIESTLNTHTIATDTNSASSTPTGLGSGSPDGLAVSSLAHFKPRYDIINYADVQKSKKYNDQIISEWEDVTNVASKNLPAASMIVKPITLAFCIPPNKDLLAYWDRVEDRLFKIRNCMNISGIRRQLALFQPPISPMALVRARAAGLTLEEILPLSVRLPPYRFSHLIEKAKQFAQTLQNFGSALLSALEKKDTEELILLRSVQERTILNITKKIKEEQKQESQHQYEAAIEAVTNIQNRINYYNRLIEEGLTGWERAQSISKHTATGLRTVEGVMRIGQALSALLADAGSPFAMKWGGTQLRGSAEGWAEWYQVMSSIANEISSSAGLVASFQRREQEWKHQLLVAKRELEQARKHELAAEIRKSISEKELEVHEQNIAHANELDEFYKNKFTKLGLYDYLSTSLNRLYREAYNMAYNMAKLAQFTYKFETDDETIFVTDDNWQLDNAGLLSGERLLLQLQHMEEAYIENNKRDYEITQSFSLAILKPDALMKLKQNGSTDEFHIPEVAYELVYPGGYNRFIKSVSITIPCVTGPYTNISAKLALIGSKVRKDTEPNKVLDEFPEQDSVLIPLTERNNTSIVTSHGKNDSGTFELNFRDERYLPFEGAGAISTWSLELPRTIRSFDYNTISDVLIHISYTFKEDVLLREAVEQKFKEELSEIASSIGLFRLISLKHEFPNSFHQLLHPSTGQPQNTEFDLDRKHFPYFISDKELVLSPSTKVKVILKPKVREGEIDTSGLSLKVNNLSVGSWDSFDETKMKVSDVSITGSPIKKWTINAGLEGLDEEEIDDVLILLTYTASSV